MGEDKAAVNGWLAIANSFCAETMAHQGWDTLTIDLQHGVVDYQAMVGMLQAISTTATVPIVRVPWLEPGIIMKTLDAGAYGVICPMVNTREEAQRFVAYTSYAPGNAQLRPGARAAVRRRRLPDQSQRDHRALRDDRDRAGARQPRRHPRRRRAWTRSTSAPRICRWRWAAKPSFDDVEPKVAQAIDHIVARAKAHGVVAGIHNGRSDVAKARVARGFRFVTVSSTRA